MAGIYDDFSGATQPTQQRNRPSSEMNPYYQDEQTTIYNGDCREILQALPDDSVDAVVTDPPYGLAFMGKRWDYDVPGVEVWQECLRVLKPGGHLLAFAGTRTQHRMAVRIEDAGFEIRDMIAWVYGSGFPKSLDVSKAIDKAAGAERTEVIGVSSVTGARSGSSFDDGCKGNKRTFQNDNRTENLITAPATPEAQRWQGWGTALKPALEPITVARKPLSGTVAETVLQYGTGALNVDGCRVGTDKIQTNRYTPGRDMTSFNGSQAGNEYVSSRHTGRWPANLIHDGSDEVTGLFPSEDGEKSEARFFYTAKADKSDRGHGNNHPTVKPQALMRYLVRLVCPPGGVVLDPFGGSGTTAAAARLEQCRSVLCELSAEYCDIAVERLRQRVLF